MTRAGPARLPGDDALFHLLVDTVRDYAIFALDATGRIATWNRGAQHIKGYAADEAIGHHFSLFFTDEDREGGRPERLLRTAREQGRVEDEAWRVRKDGSRFWASVVITALLAEDGALIGYAKITRDLTERRAAEQALRRRERQLAEAQSLAGLGGWEWNVATDRVEWTDELHRIYGIEPDDFGGTLEAYLRRVHPDDRERVRGEIEAASRRGGAFEFEERIVRSDGSVRVLRSRGHAVVDARGATTQLFGSCLDITDLRDAQEKALQLVRAQAAREAAEAHAHGLHFLVRASEALAASRDYEQSLRNVADLAVGHMADCCAIDLVEADGSIRRVALAHADPAARELVARMAEQYPPGRGTPHGPWRVIETGELEALRDIRDDTLQRLAQDEAHLELLRAFAPRSSVAVPLTSRGDILGALTLVRVGAGRELSDNDVSVASELGRHVAEAIENARLRLEVEQRNRRLEDQAAELEMQAEELQAQVGHNEELLAELESANMDLQQRTAEAEQANRAKSDFLAAMSHELRTPLNAIFGYADLIQMGLHGPVTNAQQEALERIKRNQEALLVLINDILNFAKLEAGGLVIENVELPVRGIVADLEQVVGFQIQQKQLEFESRPFPAGLRVYGDRERTEQILRNLLTNAIKFTDAGGRITLSVEAADSVVHLRVSDTGRGIPADRLEAIFDPFVQIDRMGGESSARGVGLGLAISRELAQAMGGSLDVESDVGRGSTFTLTMPRAADE